LDWKTSGAGGQEKISEDLSQGLLLKAIQGNGIKSTHSLHLEVGQAFSDRKGRALCNGTPTQTHASKEPVYKYES
jgi:hypothetical protein